MSDEHPDDEVIAESISRCVEGLRGIAPARLARHMLFVASSAAVLAGIGEERWLEVCREEYVEAVRHMLEQVRAQ